LSCVVSGTHCEYRCCLDCGANGRCNVIEDDGDVHYACDCAGKYTGDFCEIHVPDPVSKYTRTMILQLLIKM